MIEFACLDCGRILKARETSVGKRAKCKSCGTVMTIPPLRLELESALPLIVTDVPVQIVTFRPAQPAVRMPPPQIVRPPQVARLNSMGIAAMILGILSIFTMVIPMIGGVVSVMAVVFGCLGLFAAEHSGGLAFAMTGLLLGGMTGIVTVLPLLVLLLLAS